MSSFTFLEYITGLRLGYGVTSNEAFIRVLHTHQNPWTLNSIGAFAGELMMKDTEYITRTRTLILSERFIFKS